MELLHKLLSTPLEFLRDYGAPFVIVLSLLVFVHEWGHYIVARHFGVRVKNFSIGFGPELFGRTDKNGTRWSFSLIPLGGYVQMFGDSDPASSKHSAEVADGEETRPMTAEEKKVAFFSKPVGQRAAIVFAGPAINYLFAVLILTGLYITQGQPYTPPIAAKIVEGSPAAKANIQPDDKILAVNGEPIQRFQQLRQAVMLNLDKPMELEIASAVKKNGQTVKGEWQEKTKKVMITPELKVDADRFGFKHSAGRIGIASTEEGISIQEHSIVSGFTAAIAETYYISRDTLKSLGQMIRGTRSADELGGILRIGAYAGEFAKNGWLAFVTFTALLSINLGLINLLPIPMLDGGHLTMYAMEKARGKPVGERVQEYALRFGMVFLLSIMIFATWNDIVQLKIVDYFAKLVS